MVSKEDKDDFLNFFELTITCDMKYAVQHAE